MAGATRKLGEIELDVLLERIAEPRCRASRSICARSKIRMI